MIGLFCVLFFAGRAFSAFAYQQWLRADRRVVRALGRAPTTTIARAGGGVRKVTGRLGVVDTPLTAPLSRCPGAAYTLIVEELRLGGWTPLYHEKRAVRFTLEDGSGEALADPAEHFELALANNLEGRSTGRRPHPALLAHLRRMGVATESRLGLAKKLRFEEAVLVPDSTVSVGGQVGWEPDPGGAREGYRDTPGRLVVRGTPELPLLISDASPAHGRLPASAPLPRIAAPAPPGTRG